MRYKVRYHIIDATPEAVVAQAVRVAAGDSFGLDEIKAKETLTDGAGVARVIAWETDMVVRRMADVPTPQRQTLAEAARACLRGSYPDNPEEEDYEHQVRMMRGILKAALDEIDKPT